ncbi:MAG: hypothetical protein V4719_00740 [Planctomycetota bacterium]
MSDIRVFASETQAQPWGPNPAYAAALEYHEQTEMFDQMICTKRINGVAVPEPGTPQGGIISRNALETRKAIIARECHSMDTLQVEQWLRDFRAALSQVNGEQRRRREFFSVLARDVKNLLIQVARGKATPRPVGGEYWEGGHCGEITYLIDEWTVVVFWDCGDWDYISEVTGPCGMYADYEDFADKPDDMLCRENREQFNQMVDVFMGAKPGSTYCNGVEVIPPF